LSLVIGKQRQRRRQAEEEAGRGGGAGAEVAGTKVAEVTGKCNDVTTKSLH